jgi:hypothetical protein
VEWARNSKIVSRIQGQLGHKSRLPEMKMLYTFQMGTNNIDFKVNKETSSHLKTISKNEI